MARKASSRNIFTAIWCEQSYARPRVVTGLLLLLSIGSTSALAMHSLLLAERLEAEKLRVDGINEFVALTENNLQRLDVLEAHVRASNRVIADAAESVVLLQGAYGFIDAESGKPLRFVGVASDGEPLRSPSGQPYVTLDGAGPPFESLFTGSAFVAEAGGILLTNRHVAEPWEFDRNAQALIQQGLTPVMHRFVGYVAGLRDPFDVEVVLASEEFDAAVLRAGGRARALKPLLLSKRRPAPGDDVIVLGYPTGIRALLARTSQTFFDQVAGEGQGDFWFIAHRLAEEGHVAPLATRGIVGQVTTAAVVYDAATTNGGSGGPVIDVDGSVVAINSAVMTDFTGSNLGVPAEQARGLLAAIPRKQSQITP